MSLGCLVKGYFPGPVEVEWDKTPHIVSNITFRSDLPRVTTSQVILSGRQPEQEFTCRVRHALSSEFYNKTFRGCLAFNVTRPTVRLLHSSCKPGGFHCAMQLLCLISGYTPGDLEVTWLRNGRQIGSPFKDSGRPEKSGQLASTQRELNITRQDWALESNFTCRVTSQGLTYEDYTWKCADSEPRGVCAYVVPPSPLDLYLHKRPKLTCVVADLESKDNIKVEWLRERGRPVKGNVTTRRHPNATISLTSTLAVETKDWTDGEIYQCKVTIHHLPKPIFRTVAKAPGKRMAPQVHVFRPPEEESRSQATLTLTCLVQHFLPADISLQWLHNNVEIPSSRHSTTAPLEADGSFFLFSLLKVRQDEWVQSNQFTCRVYHEALPNSRTLDYTVSKGPELDLQDLCTEEAEGEDLEGLWTSTYTFISLFLISVSYGATVTVLKVKWVLSATLPGAPQSLPDYANIPGPGRRLRTHSPPLTW